MSQDKMKCYTLIADQKEYDYFVSLLETIDKVIIHEYTILSIFFIRIMLLEEDLIMFKLSVYGLQEY